MALMGAAGGQWNVGTICTGVLTTLAGFFGLLGLLNLSAEVEARKQAKQGQRGQMELLLSGCMMVRVCACICMYACVCVVLPLAGAPLDHRPSCAPQVFAGTGFMLLLVSGVDESHLSTDVSSVGHVVRCARPVSHCAWCRRADPLLPSRDVHTASVGPFVQRQCAH